MVCNPQRLTSTFVVAADLQFFLFPVLFECKFRIKVPVWAAGWVLSTSFTKARDVSPGT